MGTDSIYNYRKVSDLLITGGQPSEEQLKSAAQEGFQIVINLATVPSRNSLEDEAGLVKSLGMDYYHIPVDWENPTESDFTAFEKLMDSLPAVKTLLHCAANYRVTAFYSLYALKHLGWPASQAEAFRASIWQGSNYPAWEALVRRIQAQIRPPL